MKFISLVLFMVLSATAMAAPRAATEVSETSSTTSLANINHGNFEINAAFSFTDLIPSGSSSFSAINFSLAPQYFFMDRFSAGFTSTYSRSFGSSTAGTWTGSLGPAASYYFWQENKLTAYVSANTALNGQSNLDSYFNIGASVGVKYFITPSVAFGPALSYNHIFGRTRGISTYEIFAIPVGFAIHL